VPCLDVSIRGKVDEETCPSIGYKDGSTQHVA
jgi:hypothetical protein